MAKITFRDNPVNTIGELPAVGSVASGFSLVKADLSELSLLELNRNDLILIMIPR